MTLVNLRQTQPADQLSPSPMRVMLVDDNPRRAALVEQQLAKCGLDIVSVLPSASGLLFQFEQLRPDVVLIDLASPDRDVLESLSIVNRQNPTPIVMYSQEEDPGFIAQAINAGVTAYLVDGINPEKVKPMIDVAMAQFASFQRLRQALDSTRNELADRKIIEKAKGLIMAKQHISENEAFKAMRTLAMNQNLTLAEMARQIIHRLGPRHQETGDQEGQRCPLLQYAQSQ